MSSGGGGRKRHHRSKAGSHHKNIQSESSQRVRDTVSHNQKQQKQQQNASKQNEDTKCVQTQQIPPAGGKQQQKQKQLKQTPDSTVGDTDMAIQPQNPNTNNTSVNTSQYQGKKKVTKTNQTEQDKNNVTLHTAIFWRRKDLVESLIKTGSNPYELDQQGNTAFIAACKTGDAEMMTILWKSVDSDCVHLFLSQTNKEGDTALHACAVTGNEEGCRFLISKQCSISATNQGGETALHLAAKCDHVTICNLLLDAVLTSYDSSLLHRLVLSENERGQTAICVSILHQYTQITRILLDTLDPEKQATYLENRFRKVLNESQQICYNALAPSSQHAREVFLHGLLISVSVLMIRLTDRSKLFGTIIMETTPRSRLDECLTKTDIIQILVRVSCNQYSINQIIPITCFLLVYLVEGISDEKKTPATNFKISLPRRDVNLIQECSQSSLPAIKFLQQFVNCNGPNNLLLKVSEIDVNETSDAMLAVTIALPVIALVRSEAGRSWLEANRSHLTFLKEIVLQKRSMLDMLTNACPLLSRSHLDALCGDFINYVETMEARDRERNLADLLIEEERDRKRRERKRRKHKKQILVTEIKSNEQIPSTLLLDLSSDEEKEECLETHDHELNQNITAPRIQTVFGGIDKNDPKQNGLTNRCLEMPRVVRHRIDNEDGLNYPQYTEKVKGSDHQLFTQVDKPINISSKNNTKRNIGSFEDLSRLQLMHIESKDIENEFDAGNNTLRWADVAKIGCSTSEREMICSKASESQSRIFPNRTTSCEWPLSSSTSKNDLFPAFKVNTLSHVMQQPGDCNLRQSWYNDNTPYMIDDTNSDEESSDTSSSSFDSPSSLLSDSFHVSNNTPSIVDNCKEDLTIGEKLSLKNMPFKPSKRRKLKRTGMKTQDSGVETHCTSSFDNLIDISALGGSLENSKNTDSKLPLPLPCDTLVRTWSDNVINLPQSIAHHKTQSLELKDTDILPFSTKQGYWLKGSYRKPPRDERILAKLPWGTKGKGCKSNAGFSIGQRDSLIHHSKISNLQQKSQKSNSNKTNTTIVSTLHTEPSNIIGTSSSAESKSLFYTPPPPGFKSFNLTLPFQNVDVQLNKSTVDIPNKLNTASSSMGHIKSNKGRMITTVFLDKVVNPPSSLQTIKVPSLSSLAWKSCDHESKLSWSDLRDSKPTISHAASNCKTEILNNSLNISDVVMDDDTSLFHKHNGENCKISVPVKGAMECNSSNVQTLTSFSTILMNRIQQRSNQRHANSIQGGNHDGIQLCNSVHTDSAFVQNSNSNEHEQSNINHITKLSPSVRGVIDVNASDRNCGNCFNQPLNENTSIENQQRQDTGGCVVGDGYEKNTKNPQARDSIKVGRLACVEARSRSPLVLFPERIRDESNTSSLNCSNFPSFHDVQTSDFLSDMFSDPLSTDNIAMNQIRQKIVSNNSNHHSLQDTASQSHESSDVDLDYYASIYQMKFRDVLVNKTKQTPNFLTSRNNSYMNKTGGFKDSRDWPSNQNVFTMPSMSTSQMDSCQTQKHSVRWNRHLQKLLDVLWTTRQQYGNIVLPNSVAECSIGMVGNALILLGFLIDGPEVAVFVLDKTLTQVTPRLVEIMSNPDVDRYFLMQCKSFSEHSNVQYIAVELYEFVLCEYLQLYLPSCNHNQEIYTLLVWQLFQALAFLHLKLGMPHGCLAPNWVFINKDGNLRVAIFGVTPSATEKNKQFDVQDNPDLSNFDYRHIWRQNDEMVDHRSTPSFYSDIHAAGKLACFILTKGQHFFGMAHLETEINFLRDHLSCEAFDLISPMLGSDPKSHPNIDQCLKHPIFWSAEKKFRLILIVGSDVLTEMKTGVALTGTGAPTMMEILSLIDINAVSPNWIHEVDSTVLKEMRSFRVYKNNLAELTLFVYNCCLHFDKLSNMAKEVLDDPCKYFQNLFPGLFMAIFRSLKSSDRIDRTCYKPFF